MNGVMTETAKAQVRQTTDRWFIVEARPVVSGGAFPNQVVFGVGGILDVVAAPRGVQSAARRARGFARVRGGVTSTSAGTIFIMQSWTMAQASFAVTFTAATVIDPISGLSIVDFDIAVVREFAMIRFTGGVDLAGVFEAGSFLLPVG
jgi:hypothetical protein